MLNIKKIIDFIKYCKEIILNKVQVRNNSQDLDNLLENEVNNTWFVELLICQYFQ